MHKLDKAESLMTEAAIHLSNAKHTEEVSNLRAKRLDVAYTRMNKVKMLIDRRSLEQNEHDLFAKDPLSNL